MKTNQNMISELNSLFSYYPADLIEAALLPLMPTSGNEINEHTDIQQLFYAELSHIIQGNLLAYQKTSMNKIADVPENQALADSQAIISILAPMNPYWLCFLSAGQAKQQQFNHCTGQI